MKLVAASHAVYRAGEVARWRTRTADGGEIEVPALILGIATREEFYASRRERGIDRYEPRGNTDGANFYVVTTD